MRLSANFSTVSVVLFFCIKFLISDALAETFQSNTFLVKAEIIKGCIFDKTTYNLELKRQTDLLYTGSVDIKINCSSSTTATISLNNGLHDNNNQHFLTKAATSDRIPYTATLSDKTQSNQTQLVHSFNSLSDAYKFTITATGNLNNLPAPGVYTDQLSITVMY